jgi:hypothetical protein
MTYMLQLVFGERRGGRRGENLFFVFFAFKNVILTHINNFCEKGFNSLNLINKSILMTNFNDRFQ